MYPTLCVSYFVFIPLRIRLTSYIPLLDLILSVLHSAHIPFRVCPTPCVPLLSLTPNVSHSARIPFRVCPTPCVSYPICVRYSYISPRVHPTVSITLRVYPLRVYPTRYRSVSISSVCIPLHICLTLGVSLRMFAPRLYLTSSVSHSVRIPLRVCPIPCVPHIVRVPILIPLRVYPTLCVPLHVFFTV